jgi:hypothetical protein
VKCPHCSVEFHDVWNPRRVDGCKSISWGIRSVVCPKCEQLTIEVGKHDMQANEIRDAVRVYPIGANRGPVSSEVPKYIAQDYKEACLVLPLTRIMHDGGDFVAAVARRERFT